VHAHGVQHNDVEPRSVVTVTSRSKSNLSKAKSESGPTLLVDFDRAEMGHACGGAACGELGAVAGALGLDIDTGVCMYCTYVRAVRLTR
jgi:hypothetical protein